MSDPKDERALIARMRAGDESAMSDLYDRYSGIVYGVALRVLGSTSAAEESILQEVFLQLWRNPAGRLMPIGESWGAVAGRDRA